MFASTEATYIQRETEREGERDRQTDRERQTDSQYLEIHDALRQVVKRNERKQHASECDGSDI